MDGEAVALYNLGNSHWRAGRLGDAAESYLRSIAICPIPEARLNLGWVYLAMGRDAEGWRLYANRPENKLSEARKLGFPEWQGEPLAGKRLFIWVEQGLGDQIFAARFVRRLGAASVTMVAPPELASLFTQLGATVIPRTGVVPVGPDFDYWTLPLSLPRWAEAEALPYLRASPKSSGRIGVMWRGNQRPDPGRSLPSPLADQLLALPGAVSLQPEDSGARNLQETAELIAGLDLVLTVDTSVAHLTGALGKPGVVLLQHHQTDWRWRESRPGRSAWYPSLTLIRQERPGDWQSVIAGAKSLSMAAPAE